ncbi:hypothetical protein GCM10011376_09340 [Nocardioides flavus (ex Wang et al. 2016)]|uniref:Secreted protein n=1 Tax=Nocardioides flavus (ex Wang et al. 2016) TaxID=2058780 RepID=A0ABQ3HJJ1_9ACTN|nr:hypothetical protein GCM10011376_09340 [Nocardioides flavus (ex Wang et al. 2016)]
MIRFAVASSFTVASLMGDIVDGPGAGLQVARRGIRVSGQSILRFPHIFLAKAMEIGPGRVLLSLHRTRPGGHP